MFLKIMAFAASFDNSESDSSCPKPLKRKSTHENGPPTTTWVSYIKHAQTCIQKCLFPSPLKEPSFNHQTATKQLLIAKE